MEVIVSGQQNNRKAFAHLPASPKTKLPKQDHLESSVMSLWDINFDSVFISKTFQQCYTACTCATMRGSQANCSVNNTLHIWGELSYICVGLYTKYNSSEINLAMQLMQELLYNTLN